MPKDKRYIDLREPGFKSDFSIRAHVFLTADNRAVVFNYGHDGNTVPWTDVLNVYLTNPASFQPGQFGIVPYRNGFIIDEARDNTTRWSANINRYSHDLKEIVNGLVAVGLAGGSTPIWIGNWAQAKPKRSMGSVNRILAQKDDPSRLTLYHGTSNWRWEFIKEHGLTPIDLEGRMWKKEKNLSGHRDSAVYMTASLSQAEYYANKAARIDIKNINRVTGLNAYRNMHSPNAEDVTKRLGQWYHEGRKIEPVILQVSVPKSQYVNLRADDDFLQTAAGANSSPLDWETSLRVFGQVAFEGSIPASRIKFFSSL